mmetsp:Transcript_29217/g.85255  ORF Transcript_29217/g.85255 Transcript_29217/m.85255 type:complete len:227 (+) Transcript_29217:611-1291(+)
MLTRSGSLWTLISLGPTCGAATDPFRAAGAGVLLPFADGAVFSSSCWCWCCWVAIFDAWRAYSDRAWERSRMAAALSVSSFTREARCCSRRRASAPLTTLSRAAFSMASEDMATPLRLRASCRASSASTCRRSMSRAASRSRSWSARRWRLASSRWASTTWWCFWIFHLSISRNTRCLRRRSVVSRRMAASFSSSRFSMNSAARTMSLAVLFPTLAPGVLNLMALV